MKAGDLRTGRDYLVSRTKGDAWIKVGGKRMRFTGDLGTDRVLVRTRGMAEAELREKVAYALMVPIDDSGEPVGEPVGTALTSIKDEWGIASVAVAVYRNAAMDEGEQERKRITDYLHATCGAELTIEFQGSATVVLRQDELLVLSEARQDLSPDDRPA